MGWLYPQGDTFSEDAINFFYNLSMDTELKMNVIKTEGERSVVVGGRPELSSFSQEYTEYAGWRGSMAAVCFFKMLIMMHCIFIQGRYKSTFSKYFFGEGGRGSQKRVLCVRLKLIMLTILDDCLVFLHFVPFMLSLNNLISISYSSIMKLVESTLIFVCPRFSMF